MKFLALCLSLFIPCIVLAESLEEATIDSIHQAIKEKKLTSAELVEHYLNRIATYNLDSTHSPPLNAIVTINPSIRDQARELDVYFANYQKLKGPLHGIPIFVKDNIDTYDSPTSAGTLALLGSQPIEDAFLVKQLRDAGALIMAKTTMDELASGLSGVSSRSGRTGNAYDTRKNAGGSSGGSGVSVSANFTLGAIGTDNSGSVRIPASYNGIYGLRPSTGLISQSGIFPGGNLDGVAGPMTRTVKDLALILDVIAQPDLNDPKTQGIPRPKSYTTFLNSDGLKGKRIGVLQSAGNVDQFRGADDKTLSIYEKVFRNMEQLGATLVRDINLPDYNLDRKHNAAGEIEDVNTYLASFPSTREDFADICSSRRVALYDGVNACLKDMQETPKKFGKEYQEVLNTFEKNRKYVEKVMDNHKLDALIVPIDSRGAAREDTSFEAINCLVASNSGLPGMAIIAGYTPMPVGIELIGRQYDEPTLIEIAYAYEHYIKPRMKPKLIGKLNPKLPLDIPQMNNFFTMIGYRTFNRILKNEKSEQLTGERFRKIIQND